MHERRKIDHRQPRGSETGHMRGNTKSLGYSELVGFHWGAAHFPAQSPFIDEIGRGLSVFHLVAQLTAH